MHVAVAQLAVVQACLSAAFLSQFLDAGDVLALFFVALNLFQKGVSSLGVDMELVV